MRCHMLLARISWFCKIPMMRSALHLEELHVVTCFDANASVIQGTRKNTRFKIWELEKNGGWGCIIVWLKEEIPNNHLFFVETLQIMVDNYIITISTGDRWISSTINSITGITGVTHRKQSHPWRKSPLWMITWSGVLGHVLVPAVYHAGKWLGTWWNPPKKKTPEKSEA